MSYQLNLLIVSYGHLKFNFYLIKIFKCFLDVAIAHYKAKLLGTVVTQATATTRTAFWS